MKLVLLTFLSCWICFAVQCEEEAARKPLSILMASNPLPGHLSPVFALGEELVRRGHEVSLCTTPMKGSDIAEKNSESAGMKFISAGEGYLTYAEFQAAFAAVGSGNSSSEDRWKVFNLHPDTSIKMGKFLDGEKLTSYDIVVATERLSPVMACLSKRWAVPVVILGTTHQCQTQHLPEWPFPPFYTRKQGTLQTSDDMSFTERLYAVLFNTYVALFARFYTSRFEFVCPDASISYSYMNNFLGTRAPHIIPTVIGFEYPRSISSLTHYVGPLLSKKPQVLPTEMKKWLDSKPERSVVVVSMGSVAHLTREQGRIIVQAIQSTGYSAIWSLRGRNRDILEGIEIDEMQFHLSKWMPQVAVLNHTAIAMALLHGGMNGVHEALSYGVPIIAIPFWNDQGDVVARLQNSGAGVQILRKHLTLEVLVKSMEDIRNGRHTSEVLRLMRMFQEAGGGVERAARLIEHYSEVGYDHLVPAYAKYDWTWIQYHNADVKAVVLVVLMALGYCVLRLVISIWRHFMFSKDSLVKKAK